MSVFILHIVSLLIALFPVSHYLIVLLTINAASTENL